MNAGRAQPLPAIWKDRLDLSNREVPDLYEDPSAVGRSLYANAIRTALGDLGASAVFCVQGVPTVVIVLLDEYEREQVLAMHGALWNQGLATLLLVLAGDTVRAFSLARIPYSDDHDFDARCLVRQLDAVADGLAIKDFIYGAESGRLWERHAGHFRASERIDQVFSTISLILTQPFVKMACPQMRPRHCSSRPCLSPTWKTGTSSGLSISGRLPMEPQKHFSDFSSRQTLPGCIDSSKICAETSTATCS